MQNAELANDLSNYFAALEANMIETSEGTFLVGDGLVKVVISQSSGRPYAKRETASGWEYAPGVIATLTVNHFLTLEAAKAHGRKTGECVCCRRTLTDPVSIEEGIGPVCASKWFGVKRSRAKAKKAA